MLKNLLFKINQDVKANLPFNSVNRRLACHLLCPKSPYEGCLDVPGQLVSWCLLTVWDWSPKLPSSRKRLSACWGVLRVSSILSWAGEGLGGECLTEWSGFELILIILWCRHDLLYLSNCLIDVCVSDQFGGICWSSIIWWAFCRLRAACHSQFHANKTGHSA